MGRPRSFDESEKLALAARVFLSHGYEGTSIDDLVQATALQRGSIYKAFGSKRGLFLACLENKPSQRLAHEDLLDLALIALLELAPRDDGVREAAANLLADLAAIESLPDVLGRRLLARAHINP